MLHRSPSWWEVRSTPLAARTGELDRVASQFLIEPVGICCVSVAVGSAYGQQVHYPTDDNELAATLATRAGELLVNVREELVAQGADGGTIKDEGDRRSHVWLTEQLAAARPDDAVLSEESTEDEERSSGRLGAKRVWIIDPVDGTREYGEGRSDWAVHVALAIDGDPTIGAVALPGLGLTLGTGDPVSVPDAPDPLRVVVSRTRPPAEALAIAEALGAELVEMGSAGAKTMSVLRGESDIYPHSGGQYEWDSAAPVAVARAAGLHCSRLDGSPLRYNQADTRLPDLLVCRPEHAQAVIDAAAEPG
ncbi:MAG: 3'(2'),5'-bisphosphate nucleotidase CysQ [Actinomycetia bacterium]|nr:3'(2'),5'-bisphosphate nucleotidase CysQ [Actinomycetes bacterium]